MAYIIRHEDLEATRSARYEFRWVVLEETDDRRKLEGDVGWVDGRLSGNAALRQGNMGWQVTATTVDCEYAADLPQSWSNPMALPSAPF